MPAIDAKGLKKTYAGAFGAPDHEALRGVDLSVEPGVAFGLIGPNGAGKTTFIKILLGIVRPTAGAVTVLGGDPSDPRVRARLGYLPENLHLPDASTPLQFLASVARLKRTDASRAVLGAMLERVGLGADQGRKCGAFSKGMKQRLGLAGALVGQPELIVLDEPTDGIDPLGRVEVRRILSEESARGATIFLNSHLLAETERVCSRAGILAKGRIVREGGLDELRRRGTRFRLKFSGVFDGSAAGLGVDADGCYVDAASVEALNAVIDRLRTAGALITDLREEQQDLEDVFVSAIEGTP